MLEADVEVDRRDFTVRAAFGVAPGERLALFGPSGAGKTTILEAIAGLLPPRRGSVVLGGRVLTRTEAPRCAVPPWRRRVGLLRQDPALFPHLSVRQNLTYAPGAAARGEELIEIAGRLGISGLLDDRPARLSGGQAHRVALGRLLLSHCDALLLDEPYTGLDASLRHDLTDLVRELVAARQVPSVLVAHELAAAQAFADRLAVLDRGQVLQVGSPSEVVATPARRRVAELVGYRSFVPVTRDSPGGPVAGVHPDRVAAGAQPGRGMVLAGPVRSCRPSGAGWEAGIEAAGTVVPVRLPDRPPADGAELVVTLLDPPCYGPDGALLAQHMGQVRT
ncbi:MAG TPA: ABC transporter ATP-binding protein [Streptosporangiaceae bacterium]|nr:ABC transporter ATP-binding protein [Streptosporangiaceae bacterium]